MKNNKKIKEIKENNILPKYFLIITWVIKSNNDILRKNRRPISPKNIDAKVLKIFRKLIMLKGYYVMTLCVYHKNARWI